MIELVDPNDASGVRENHYLIISSPSELEFLRATGIPARDNAGAPTEPSAAAVWKIHKLAVANRILFN
jgi:hypothetical protein